MSNRVDITFYDSYSDTVEIPSIKITKENFNIMFSLIDESGEHYIEESIYYPKAYFVDKENEEIKLERCKIDNLGSKYKHFYQNSDLNNFFCLSNINYI